MNREEFEKNWQQLQGKIPEKWSKFNKDEIAKINGKYEQFLDQLQKKYGYSKEQAEQEMKNWQEGKKKGTSNKEARPFGGEEKPSVLLAHQELLHEDKDPIYPPEPRIGEWAKGSKKGSDDQGYKDKKRKAG